jgi:hypothetical protein
MDKYFSIGLALGVPAGFLTFIGSYAYCIATYGLLFGLGLGWCPSLILGSLVVAAMTFLWGPTLILLLASGIVFVLK